MGGTLRYAPGHPLCVEGAYARLEHIWTYGQRCVAWLVGGGPESKTLENQRQDDLE